LAFFRLCQAKGGLTTRIQSFSKALLLAPFMAGLCCAQWNHDPASPIGQLEWGQVAPAFATCGTRDSSVGQHQSPVDIQTTAALPGANVPISLNYAPLNPRSGSIEKHLPRG
jgi:carbonic anhydrase